MCVQRFQTKIAAETTSSPGRIPSFIKYQVWSTTFILAEKRAFALLDDSGG